MYGHIGIKEQNRSSAYNYRLGYYIGAVYKRQGINRRHIIYIARIGTCIS